MWDVIMEGPIIIYKMGTEVVPGPGADPEYLPILDPETEYTSKERKQVGLDNFARNTISSTVTNAYLSKIINCETAKIIKENKLTTACQKFDNFKQLSNESIEQMELRFSSIILEIKTIRTGKYTRREKNLKVLSALSAEWITYKVLQQSRSDLSELKSESLFSILKANEYNLKITIEESSSQRK